MPKKHNVISLSIYFVSAFVVMYGLVGLGKLGVIPTASPLFMLLFIVGSWSPTIAALLTLLFIGKGKDAGKLFRGWGRWNVGVGWYAAALSPFLVSSIVAFIYVIIMKGAPPGPLAEITFPAVGMSFFFTVFTGATGEEPGWRAFATPLLEKHLGALGTSFVLGSIWVLWHLPLWFLEGTPQYGMPFAPFAIACVVETVLFTWIYNNTKGSLAMTSIFHFSTNASTNIIVGFLGLVPIKEYFWIQTVLFTVFALLVIIFFGDGKLSRKPVSEMPFGKNEW